MQPQHQRGEQRKPHVHGKDVEKTRLVDQPEAGEEACSPTALVKQNG
jgi:hypothetical protein